MAQKHATRNELAAALIDIYLRLEFEVLGRRRGVENPIAVAPRATREQLRREIMNIKIVVSGILHQYQELMDDEVVLNNYRCAKRLRRFAG